jgi:hypothetical protein
MKTRSSHYDRQSNSWVGVDAERLRHGGPKHNASSFVPISGFAQANSRRITVMPIDSNLFDSEFAAFFKSERLSEYLYNRVSIHSGNYDGRGPFSGNRAVSNPANLDLDAEMFGGTDLILEGPGVVAKNVTVPKSAVEAFQKGDFVRVRRTILTHEQLLELKRRCDEIGLRGERWALDHERKRLIRAKRSDLAARIEWTSQSRPYQGYDIVSFENSGEKRFIEVKASISQSRQFEISDNEWRRAGELSDKYYIYRITRMEDSPSVKILRDPLALLAEGKLEKKAASWTVTYNP